MQETKDTIKSYIFMSYENMLKVLYQKDLRIVIPEDCNDPSEYLPKEHSKEDVTKIQNLLQRDIGFLSFSSDFRKPAMWGLYSDSHKGCCIEFEFPVKSRSTDRKNGLPYIELDLQSNKNCFPSFSDIPMQKPLNDKCQYVMWPVDYKQERAEYTKDIHGITWNEKKISSYHISEWLVRKDPSWQFEEEMRIFVTYANPEITRENMFFIKGFNRYIKRILLGVKCPYSEERVLSIISYTKIPDAQYDIEVSKMEFTPDKYLLQETPSTLDTLTFARGIQRGFYRI